MHTEEAMSLLTPVTNTPTIIATKTTMALPAVQKKKKPAQTSLRTFDSSDDLLQEEEGQNTTEDTQENHHGDDAESKETRRALLWDCRAIYLMPHSPKIVLKAGVAYVRSYHSLLEVAFLGVFLLLCYLLPDYIVDKHVRPIPYQVVDNQTLIDLTFGNDYRHNETIPGSLLNLICVVFPMCVFGLGIFFGPLGDYHAALCSYLLAMGLKIFIVACIKNYAGYLRPSFYSMCQFQPDKFVCNDETTSARESFPSGHAATALSSMTLLALFLLGKVRGATRQRGLSAAVAHSHSSSADHHNFHDDCIIWTPSLISKVLAVLAVSPVCLGMFIATSRVRDNWHHPADVVCGGIIGACCALFAHGLWYPSVYSYYAGIPLATVKDIWTGRRSEAKAAALRLDLGMESEV